jgi:Flp pilus assembly protein TadG
LNAAEAGQSGESGQALIETAIASSLLVILLLGAVELGRMAYAAIEVSNAAKAAAQYGSMNGGAFLNTDATGLDATGMLNAAQADAGNLGTAVQWNGNPTYSCTCSGTGTALCTAPAIPSGCTTSHLVITVKANVKATFNPLIYIPYWTKTGIVLYGSAQQQVLQ